MRKFLALIVGLCLIFCFIGCNNKEKVDVEISTGVADENYGIEAGIVKKIDFDNTVGTVSYTSHESTTTKYGTDIIVIYFTLLLQTTHMII